VCDHDPREVEALTLRPDQSEKRGESSELSPNPRNYSPNEVPQRTPSTYKRPLLPPYIERGKLNTSNKNISVA